MTEQLKKLGQHPFIAQRPFIKQFIKFGLVGVMNTMIDYTIYAALFYVVHVHYLLANIISFSVAVSNSYILNRRWTFRSDHPAWRTEAAKFIVVNIIGLGLSEILLFLQVDHLHISKLLAKLFAIVVVLFWNYVGTRFWAFRHRRPVPTPPVQS